MSNNHMSDKIDQLDDPKFISMEYDKIGESFLIIFKNTIIQGNHYNFKNYSSKISEFSNDFFDIVLVDGRSRPSCLHHSLEKIKRNGILVLDNSDRTYYLEQTKTEIEKKFTLVLSKYSPSPYSYDFTHTTIWIKNK